MTVERAPISEGNRHAAEAKFRTRPQDVGNGRLQAQISRRSYPTYCSNISRTVSADSNRCAGRLAMSLWMMVAKLAEMPGTSFETGSGRSFRCRRILSYFVPPGKGAR